MGYFFPSSGHLRGMSKMLLHMFIHIHTHTPAHAHTSAHSHPYTHTFPYTPTYSHTYPVHTYKDYGITSPPHPPKKTPAVLSNSTMTNQAP